MKAISVKQPHANNIAAGLKTVEYRTWPTKYRGPLLIVSSKTPSEPSPAGCAVAVVDLVDCVSDNGLFDWVLANPRPLKEPIPMRGQLGLYNVKIDLKEVL